MNTTRLYGKVIKKELEDNTSLIILLARPLNMKVSNEGEFNTTYSFFKFRLCGLNKEICNEIKVGKFIDIMGNVLGNSDENGNLTDFITVLPKIVKRGVVK